MNTAPSNLTTAVLFQGRYDTNTWSGDIRAYELDSDTGQLAATYKWSAHERLEREPEANWNTGREIITYDGTDGIAFRSGPAGPIATAGMLSLLDADPAKASAIVDFIRGDDFCTDTITGYHRFTQLLNRFDEIANCKHK